MTLTAEDVRQAAARIAPHVVRTPVLRSDALDAQAGASLVFKCENLQATGAFKARGAANAVFSLTGEEAARGVVTHSSGNHGAALARAASLRGIPCVVVMPRGAPQAKRANVLRYGAEIVECDPTQQAREETAARVASETGAAMVHPYDDARVMAGQGTAALELLEDHPGLDMLIAPVGGGGLLSGSAVAAKGVNPGVAVIGAEPLEADDAARSLAAGAVQNLSGGTTMADGLRALVGQRPFAVIREQVDAIVTVPEDAILRAMRALWEELKLIVEPSSAVVWAAVAEGRVEVSGRSVGLILTGGNLDLDALPWGRESA